MSQWKIDPATRDYVMENGAPVETESLTAPAYIRLRVRRKKWLYAPDELFGSDLADQKRQNPALIESLAARALQPIVEDGRAAELSVSSIGASRHGLQLQIDITDAQGEPQALTIDPIG